MTATKEETLARITAMANTAEGGLRGHPVGCPCTWCVTERIERRETRRDRRAEARDEDDRREL